MGTNESLQDRYAPNSICFGCGPKNSGGLRIKSFPEGAEVKAEWTPGPQHAAFAGFASGGIVSVLLDCNGNWAAAYSLMRASGLDKPPGTVTAEYTVRFIKPTPMSGPWQVRAWPTGIDGKKVRVDGDISSGGVRTATMSGLFVAVAEGHPAFHRWQ